MNGRAALERFLTTDPRDVGCEQAMDLLHAYADLAVTDPAAAERLYPGVAAHAEDLTGLLAAIRNLEDPDA